MIPPRTSPSFTAWAMIGSLVGFAASPLAATAADMTVNVRIEALCPSTVSPGDTYQCADGQDTTCPTQADLEASARSNLVWASLIWKPLGVSFRFESAKVTKDDSAGFAAGDDSDMVHLYTEAGKYTAGIKFYVLPCAGYCWAGCVPSPDQPDGGCGARSDGFYCANTHALTVAHELGHYFCLPHTHTLADRAESGDPIGTAMNHNGDGIADTPEDPGPPEGQPPSAKQADKDAADMIIAEGTVTQESNPNFLAADILEAHDGHEYCYWDELAADSDSPLNGWGAGHCMPTCYKRENGQETKTAYKPNTNLVMSYFFYSCTGPNLHNGYRYEAFSAGEKALVQQCLKGLDHRKSLVDACASLGGDYDSDGLCSKEDNCPDTWGADQTDTDGDGLGDLCDPCVYNPTPTEDSDWDGAGDLCDPDDDNDGCADAVDKDPLEPQVQVGMTLRPGCSPASTAKMGFAGSDSDGDGLRDCDVAEKDSDDDGTPDATDPCPFAPGGLDACTEAEAICGPAWEKGCMGPGCNLTFFLKLMSSVYPELVLEDLAVRVVDESIYVQKASARTAGPVSGNPFLLGWNPDVAPEEVGFGDVRLSLVDAATGLELPVGGFSLFTLDVSETTQGKAMMLEIDDGEVVSTRRSWGAGVPPEADLSDVDGDLVPDVADNCLEVPNPRQTDADTDAFGNACDADLDQNGLVNDADTARISACQGALLRPQIRIMPDGEHKFLVTPTQEAQAQRCLAADLDDDGEVAAPDLARATAAAGLAPGPSGAQVPPPVTVDPPPVDEDSPEAIEDDVHTQSDAISPSDLAPQPDAGDPDLAATDATLADSTAETPKAKDSSGCSATPASAAFPHTLPLFLALLLVLVLARSRRVDLTVSRRQR